MSFVKVGEQSEVPAGKMKMFKVGEMLSEKSQGSNRRMEMEDIYL